MRGGREEAVSFAASSALGDNRLLPVGQNLGEDLSTGGVAHDSAGWDGKNHIDTRAPRLVRSHSMFAALRHPPIPIGVIEERRQVGVTTNDDVSTATAIATVRASHRHAVLSPE